MQTTSSRTRAMAQPTSRVASQRQAIYREAFAHINEAITAGFYLEAITLVESLISDRLESRTSYISCSDFSFKTLEKLIQKLEKDDPDAELRSLVTERLRVWKDLRNTALHELAKIADGDTRSWADRTAPLRRTATAGLALLRAIDKRVKSLRRHASSESLR